MNLKKQLSIHFAFEQSEVFRNHQKGNRNKRPLAILTIKFSEQMWKRLKEILVLRQQGKRFGENVLKKTNNLFDVNPR